jgi:hypothetical protein
MDRREGRELADGGPLPVLGGLALPGGLALLGGSVVAAGSRGSSPISERRNQPAGGATPGQSS